MTARELVNKLHAFDPQIEVIGWGPPTYVDDGDGRIDIMGSNTWCHIESVEELNGRIIITLKDEEQEW